MTTVNVMNISQLKSLTIILLDCFYNLSLISKVAHSLLKNAKKASPLKFSSSMYNG